MTPLYITRDDLIRLRRLLNAVTSFTHNPSLGKLREELARAVVIDPAGVPPDLVTLGARVQFEDLGTNEIEEYILTLPDQADIAAGRLSVLAPIGTALIGFRAGEIVDWPTPGGIRRLRIRQVTPRSALPVVAASPAIAFTTLA